MAQKLWLILQLERHGRYVDSFRLISSLEGWSQWPPFLNGWRKASSLSESLFAAIVTLERGTPASAAEALAPDWFDRRLLLIEKIGATAEHIRLLTALLNHKDLPDDDRVHRLIGDILNQLSVDGAPFPGRSIHHHRMPARLHLTHRLDILVTLLEPLARRRDSRLSAVLETIERLLLFEEDCPFEKNDYPGCPKCRNLDSHQQKAEALCRLFCYRDHFREFLVDYWIEELCEFSRTPKVLASILPWLAAREDPRISTVLEAVLRRADRFSEVRDIPEMIGPALVFLTQELRDRVQECLGQWLTLEDAPPVEWRSLLRGQTGPEPTERAALVLGEWEADSNKLDWDYLCWELERISTLPDVQIDERFRAATEFVCAKYLLRDRWENPTNLIGMLALLPADWAIEPLAVLLSGPSEPSPSLLISFPLLATGDRERARILLRPLLKAAQRENREASRGLALSRLIPAALVLEPDAVPKMVSGIVDSIIEADSFFLREDIQQHFMPGLPEIFFSIPGAALANCMLDDLLLDKDLRWVYPHTVFLAIFPHLADRGDERAQQLLDTLVKDFSIGIGGPQTWSSVLAMAIRLEDSRIEQLAARLLELAGNWRWDAGSAMRELFMAASFRRTAWTTKWLQLAVEAALVLQRRDEVAATVAELLPSLARLSDPIGMHLLTTALKAVFADEVNAWPTDRSDSITVALQIAGQTKDPELRHRRLLWLCPVLFRIGDPRATAVLEECIVASELAGEAERGLLALICEATPNIAAWCSIAAACGQHPFTAAAAAIALARIYPALNSEVANAVLNSGIFEEQHRPRFRWS